MSEITTEVNTSSPVKYPQNPYKNILEDVTQARKAVDQKHDELDDERSSNENMFRNMVSSMVRLPDHLMAVPENRHQKYGIAPYDCMKGMGPVAMALRNHLHCHYGMIRLNRSLTYLENQAYEDALKLIADRFTYDHGKSVSLILQMSFSLLRTFPQTGEHQFSLKNGETFMMKNFELIRTTVCSDDPFGSKKFITFNINNLNATYHHVAENVTEERKEVFTEEEKEEILEICSVYLRIRIQQVRDYVEKALEETHLEGTSSDTSTYLLKALQKFAYARVRQLKKSNPSQVLNVFNASIRLAWGCSIGYTIFSSSDKKTPENALVTFGPLGFKNDWIDFKVDVTPEKAIPSRVNFKLLPNNKMFCYLILPNASVQDSFRWVTEYLRSTIHVDFDHESLYELHQELQEEITDMMFFDMARSIDEQTPAV